MEDDRGRLGGIEVKKTAGPTSSDFKALRHLIEQAGKKFLRGMLLYTSSTSVTFGPNLHAVPVGALWQLEAELAELKTVFPNACLRRAFGRQADFVIESYVDPREPPSLSRITF